MKGMTSSDGKQSGNAERVGSYEKHKSAPKPPSEPMGGGGGNESPEEVVAQHGPAHEIHIQHDHEGGVHHVHSKHPSGHSHHSQHGSAHEAHQHAAVLGGAGEPMAQGMGEPDADDQIAQPPQHAGYMG